jgi:hypothetical protein
MPTIFYYESQFYRTAKQAVTARERAGGYRNVGVYTASRGYGARRLQNAYDKQGWAGVEHLLTQEDYITRKGTTGAQNWSYNTTPRG